MAMAMPAVEKEVAKQSILGRVTAVFVYLFEKMMPDPFVFAVLLTFLGAGLAWKFAPNATPVSIVAGWYAGVFGLLTFAFQMVILVVAGFALGTLSAVQWWPAGVVLLATMPLW